MKENNINKTCINCLQCVKACKKALLPNFLYHFSINEEREGLDKFNLKSCHSCNDCDKACPSDLPLSASINELAKITENLNEEIVENTKSENEGLVVEFSDKKSKNVNLRNFEYIAFFAVIPLYLGAIGRYGTKVGVLLLSSILAGVVVDKVASLLRRDATISWNWLVWFLVPLAMPAGVPLWMPAVATGFSLIFGRHLFGGYGKNFVNVVALAVVFIHISYLGIASTSIVKPFSTPTYGFDAYASQISVSASEIKSTINNGEIPMRDILFGLIPGNISDLYPLYIIFSGFFFILFGLLDFRVPLSTIIGIVTFSLIGHTWYPDLVLSPCNQLFWGPVFAVLFFFSIDVWSLPRTLPVRWISGFIFAFFVVLLRAFSGHSESVFFALLITNIFTPILDWTLGVTLAQFRFGKVYE